MSDMQKRLLVLSPTANGDSHGGQEDTQQDGKKNGTEKKGKVEVVDLRDLNRSQRQQIVDNALATNEQSNEVLLERYAERADK